MQAPLMTQEDFKQFDCRTQLNLPSESLWLIVSGVVKSSTINQFETSVPLGYWGTGDIIGQPLSNLNPYILESLTPIEIKKIPLNSSQQLLQAVIRHSQEMKQLTYIIQTPKIPERLLLFLQWLAARFGDSTSEGKCINLGLTHQEMASTIGTTRITVTKLLSQFEQQELIYRINRKTIIIFNSSNSAITT